MRRVQMALVFVTGFCLIIPQSPLLAGIPKAELTGIGPGIQYAPAQGKAATELQVFSGLFSLISAQYRLAAGYEFGQETGYVRGGVGAGLIFASLNLEYFQPFQTSRMGAAIVPSLTAFLPCSNFGSRQRSELLCEPYLAAHLAFRAEDENRFLLGLRLLYTSM